MRDLSKQLSEFIGDRPTNEEAQLTSTGRKVFRSLKAMGERATQLRDVKHCLFEVKGMRNGVLTLRMILEGRHAVSIGHQVARRFDGHPDVESAEVVRTKNGAKVVLRPKEEASDA